MHRLRSLRRSISRSSRKSSGSASPDSSPRRSRDTSRLSISDTPPPSSPDLPSSVRSYENGGEDPPSPTPVRVGHQKADQPETAAAPRGATAPDADSAANTTTLTEPQASLASLSSSITDPPVIVESPSILQQSTVAQSIQESPLEQPLAATTGRESTHEAGIHKRKVIEDPQIAESIFVVEEEKPKSRVEVQQKIMPVQRPWLFLAIASGGFAALNGVFAKLTTASLTTTLAAFVSDNLKVPVEYANPAIRGIFFVLNLISNAIMWALFTRALTAHSSATKVSLINTSANFLVTAFLSALIFTEALPAGWFGGAALLVLGTLIIGRDRQGEPAASPAVAAAAAADEEAAGPGEHSDQPNIRDRTLSALGLGPEKEEDGADVTEMEPLLAGNETEGVRADGED